MVQIDRYLGQTPIPASAPFLLTVRSTAQASSGDMLNGVTLNLPPEITMTAPPVHIAAENEIVWRLAGAQAGNYEVKVAAGGETVEKSVCVGNDLPRISTVRLRGQFWNRLLTSAEPALPQISPIESIAINYPDRNIEIAGYSMNWIWLFFILSMVAGFIFKELLGIQI